MRTRVIPSLPVSLAAMAALICVTCVLSRSAYASGQPLAPGDALSRIAAYESSDVADKTGSFPIISGIGAALSVTPYGAEITKIFPGSAAANSGKLQDGDVLVSLSENGRTISLVGKTLAEVVNLIRGPVGTSVTLLVRPRGAKATYRVRLTREAVPLPGFISYAGLVGAPEPTAAFMLLGRATQIKLSTYRGKVVVLDFWASWCGACYSSLDKLQSIARAHPDWRGRVILLAATIDTSTSAALKTIKDKGWHETEFLSITPRKMKAIGIETIPTLLVISPEGRITTIGDPHAISVDAQVTQLLSRTRK